MSSELRSILPIIGEYAPYYDRYIGKVPAGDILTTLAVQKQEMLSLVSTLTDDQAMIAYAPGKWNIKEVVGHVTDAERIFSYRALRIGRGDTTPLPSFDENIYAQNSGFAKRTIADIALEFDHVRSATLDLLGHFGEDKWLLRGTASECVVSVRAMAWIIAGHERHHAEILRTRYLNR